MRPLQLPAACVVSEVIFKLNTVQVMHNPKCLTAGQEAYSVFECQ